MNEQWKNINDTYQVSSRGNVRSVNRTVVRGKQTVKFKGKVIKPYMKGRYLTVELWREGRRKRAYVHNLVAEAFLGPRPKGQVVRHGPNGRLDNSIKNLSYGTRSEDQQDRWRDGTHGGRAVIRSDGVEYVSIGQAFKLTGVRHSSIWKCCNGKLKTAGGYGWSYKTTKFQVYRYFGGDQFYYWCSDSRWSLNQHEAIPLDETDAQRIAEQEEGDYEPYGTK